MGERCGPHWAFIKRPDYPQALQCRDGAVRKGFRDLGLICLEGAGKGALGSLGAGDRRTPKRTLSFYTVPGAGDSSERLLPAPAGPQPQDSGESRRGEERPCL